MLPRQQTVPKIKVLPIIFHDRLKNKDQYLLTSENDRQLSSDPLTSENDKITKTKSDQNQDQKIMVE